jgi:hypothetical protein
VRAYDSGFVFRLGSDLRYAHDRGVGGEYGIRLAKWLDVAEKVLLDLHVLNDTLDNEICICKGSSQIVCEADATEDTVGFFLCHRIFGLKKLKVFSDWTQRIVLHATGSKDHLDVFALGEHLGQSVSHQAGA